MPLSQHTLPTKAIIAVAGYGTRRLPVAKAIDKCMMPLLNRPVIDYVVQDVVKAGVTDVYLVVSGDARQLRDYYSRDIALEDYLRAHGKESLIPTIRPPRGVRFHYVEQDYDDGRYGTSVPVWLARQFIHDDEYFYYISGDQTFWRQDGQSEAKRLFDHVVRTGTNGGLLAVVIPEEDVERYGIVRLDDHGNYVEIVEKPRREAAPSLLNYGSINVLPGTFLRIVDAQMSQPKEQGEYYVTDALNDFVGCGEKLGVYVTDATYLDCGTVESWVAANTYMLHSGGVSS